MARRAREAVPVSLLRFQAKRRRRAETGEQMQRVLPGIHRASSSIGTVLAPWVVCAVVVFVAAVPARRATATPLTLLTDLRAASVSTEQCFIFFPGDPPQCSYSNYQGAGPASAFAPFNVQFSDGAGSAQQNTLVSASAMSGSLSSSAGTDQTAYSRFYIEFIANVSAPFTFSGSQSGTANQSSNLVDLTTNTAVSVPTGATWDDSGTLIAGHTYRLFLEAFSSTSLAYGSGYQSPSAASFTFSVVPEPGTGVLVMAGLLGLAARRQRRA